MDAILQKSYEESSTGKGGTIVERRGDHGSTPSPDQETLVLLRLIEFRQKDLEARFKVFLEEQVGRGGHAERAIIMEQRINSALCIGKWLAGICSGLFIIFAAWVTFQVWSVRDREMVRQHQPPATQQAPLIR